MLAAGRFPAWERVRSAIEKSVVPAQSLPGPTGESNRLTVHPRGLALCLGPTPDLAVTQALQALAAGCSVLVAVAGSQEHMAPLLQDDVPLAVLEGTVDPALLVSLVEVSVVAATGDPDWIRALRRSLAARDGAIISLITEPVAPDAYLIERHLCIDTTAAGGNASLLASSS